MQTQRLLRRLHSLTSGVCPGLGLLVLCPNMLYPDMHCSTMLLHKKGSKCIVLQANRWLDCVLQVTALILRVRSAL